MHNTRKNRPRPYAQTVNTTKQTHTPDAPQELELHPGLVHLLHKPTHPVAVGPANFSHITAMQTKTSQSDLQNVLSPRESDTVSFVTRCLLACLYTSSVLCYMTAMTSTVITLVFLLHVTIAGRLMGQPALRWSCEMAGGAAVVALAAASCMELFKHASDRVLEKRDTLEHDSEADV